MAVVSEIRAVVDLVNKGMQFATYLTDTWYKSSQAMEQFPMKLKTLEMKMALWSRLVERYGMSEDLKRLLGMLRAAMNALDEETTKVQQLQASSKRSTRWYSKLKQNLLSFPDDLTATLQNIIDTLDQTYELLKMEGEVPNVLISARRHWPEKLRFGHDSKYVPLTKSVDAVRQALETPQTPPRNVVVLLGVGGSGKTSLVKGLAFVYQDSLPSQFPNGVFFLHCGRGADGISKLRELVLRMGFPLPMPKDEELQESEALLAEFSTPYLQSGGAVSTRSKTKAENLAYLQKGLSAFLEKQNLLIVLDDVWESEFLEDILIFNAQHVKYLITTQRPGLWGNSVTIEMTKPSKEDAQKILANHAELNGPIPPQLQAVADEMIKSADSNPLVLANLAWSVVTHKRANLEEKEWISTLRDLPNLINREDDAPFGFHIKYPRSVSNSIMMGLQSLPTGAQTLLCLISALCEFPFVPEIVLEVLFSKLTTPHVQSGDSFLYCSRLLEGRALIVRQDQIASWSMVAGQNMKTWTIHDLRQIVIRSKMQDTIAKIFGSLLERGNTPSIAPPADEDGYLAAALIFIFAEQKLSEEASEKIGAKMERNGLMKTALETLIWFLQPNYKQATEIAPVLQVKNGDSSLLSRTCSSSGSARQHISRVKQAPKRGQHIQAFDIPLDQHECASRAVLKYVMQGHLDDAGISGLLASSNVEIAAATCDALRTIAEIHEPPPKTKTEDETNKCVPLLQMQTEGIIRALLKLVQMPTSPDIQRKSVDALGALARHNHQAILQLKDPSALGSLAALLNEDVTTRSTQASVATTLRHLANSEEAKESILLFPGLLDRLLDLIYRPDDTSLEEVTEFAASTIARLAHAHRNKRRLAEHSHALSRLVGLLAKDVSPKVQLQGLQVLSIVSVARRDVKKILLEAPGALLERILSLMRNDGGAVDQAVQRQAAMCIANLTIPDNDQFSSATIVKVSESLSSVLSSHDVPLAVQQYVAKSCANLAAVGGDEKKHIHALSRLVGVLAKDVSPKVQLQGLEMLSIVSLARGDTKKILLEAPGALLESILSLMRNDGGAVDQAVQQQAATCIANLTRPGNNQFSNAIIVKVSESLLSVLSSHDVLLEVQQYVAKSCANLAAVGGDEKKRYLPSMEGALPTMVNLLSSGVNVIVQEQIICALIHLAVDHEYKLRIASFPHVLNRIVALMASNESNLQRQAAKLLGTLTVYTKDFPSEGTSGRSTILNHEGVLRGLVKLLGENIDPTVREQAAKSIGHLANHRITIAGDENKVLFANSPGTLEGLVGLLADSSEPSIQLQAARSLGYIAFRNESNTLLVAEDRGIVEALTRSLECVNNPTLQEKAAWALIHLAANPQNRERIAATGTVEGLGKLLTDPKVKSTVQRQAARALTLIDHEAGASVHLLTCQAHFGRGHALLELSMHEEALGELNTAREMLCQEHEGPKRQIEFNIKQRANLHKYLCFAKAMLRNYEGALQDADAAVRLEPLNFERWHERGVLKAFIGEDLEGALDDLNRGDHVITCDGHDTVFAEYHRLKHRGVIQLKLGDEAGAFADAICASVMKKKRGLVAAAALGKASLLELPAEYLNFELH